MERDASGHALEVAALECQLARETDFGTFTTPAPLHDYRACAATRTEEYTQIPMGTLVFRVRARDDVGNEALALYR